MGTTSEKLTYLNETKQELKQKINNLGGSIDDNTTFRQYANQLQNVYDNLPKTEYQEGTEVNLGKTSKGKLDYVNGVVGIGQTEQNTTTGKNLWNITDYTTSTDIVSNQSATITKQTNGFKIHTAELTNSGVYIRKVNDHIQGFASDTTYYLSFDCISSKSVSRFVYGQSSVIGTLTAGEKKKFIVEVRNTSPFVFYVNEELDLTIENIMVCATNDSNFEKYTGGQASPNPSYPQTINSVTGNQDVVVKDGNNNTIATYQLSLGDIQLNAIGNYKDELIYDVDEDKVYKNEKIGKDIYNGTENWSFTQSGTKGILFRSISQRKPIRLGLISNYYSYPGTNYSWQTIENNQIAEENNASIFIRDDSITSANAFKTWLSTHNLELYYVLNEPIETEITDTTLVNQVKALYNARSLNGTTIITSNGDLPLVIKVRALKGE